MLAVTGMMFDPLSLLPVDEIGQVRSPRALREWVLGKCHAISGVPETKRPALLHHGPFKKLYEEEAAEGKAGPGRYGRGYELVIVVEDWWFEADRDSAGVASFLEHEVATLPLCFDALHGRLDRSALQLGPDSSLRPLREPFTVVGRRGAVADRLHFLPCSAAFCRGSGPKSPELMAQEGSS